jgi:hypothetical protein
MVNPGKFFALERRDTALAGNTRFIGEQRHGQVLAVDSWKENEKQTYSGT